MRTQPLVWALLSLTLAACTYDAPLVTAPGLPIDPALLGRWQSVPQEADENPDLLVIRQSSATEYAVDNLDGDSVIHLRAFLAELAGQRLVQLEVTGDDNGPVEPGETDLFSVMDYRLEGDELVVLQLNIELVADDLPDTQALRRAFVANREAPDLFVELGRFRRLDAP